MYYDFSQLVNNTNTIISNQLSLLACNWIVISVLVVIILFQLFRSVKK